MNRDLYSYTQDYINRWVVSYADFVTMLLALFMVLYALSQINITNLKEFSTSVGDIFEVTKVNKNIEDKNLLKEKQQLIKTFSTTNTQIKMSDINISGQKNEITTLKSRISNIESDINKDAVEFENVDKLIKSKFQSTDEIYTKKETRGLIIRLNENVLFDPGSDIIKDKARVTLDKLAGVLREIPNSIKIEGHTDSKPIKTAKFPSNWELSTARATNVVRYLINNHKFNPQRLSAAGYGEYMPLTKDPIKNDAFNRRVDIVVLSSTSKIFEPEVTK